MGGSAQGSRSGVGPRKCELQQPIVDIDARLNAINASSIDASARSCCLPFASSDGLLGNVPGAIEP